VSYTQLAELYKKYRHLGFTVLGFPSNDFHQELETDEQIWSFLQKNYPDATKFPIFHKAPLGKNHPVYDLLKRQLKSSTTENIQIKGNFNKILVNRQGIAVSKHEKKLDPMNLEDEILKLIHGSQYKAPVPRTE